MPDIQTALKTALSKTLQEWDDDDEAPASSSVQPVSTSVSAPSQNIQGIPMTAPKQKNLFPIRNNVSRNTFNYVKDNPGSTRKEILEALGHQGYKEGSTASLLSQMRKCNMMHVTNGLYYTDVPEYEPVKLSRAMKKTKPAPVEIKPKRKYTKRSEGIGALLQAKIDGAVLSPPTAAPVAQAPKSFLTKLVRTQSPESIVENLNVLQARALYDYLRNIFGG